MSQSKPRKAAYKDTIVSLLSLKAHFAVSDDHPTDKSTAELGMLMLQHVPSPEKESLPWKGTVSNCVWISKKSKRKGQGRPGGQQGT
jgi:hypothetical protein